jgi:hypothetical protein
MGILRFFATLAVKSGPGSVGETAKVLALAASRLHATQSPSSPRALIGAVVKERYAAFPQVSEMSKYLLVERTMEGEASGRVPRLVQYCWELENGPMLRSMTAADMEAFDVGLSVIYDQIGKHLSHEAREFLHRRDQ